jgi:peptidoglycan/xylan/chitin deacetylase (PgdA/CDA1 family)
MDQMPLVLSYHRVVENFQRSAAHSISPMLVSAETFEKQLAFIGKRYDFVTLDELAQSLESGRKTGKPLAAVTFDDGYGDTYYHAFPILKRMGIPMGVFVVTDLVGSTDLQVHDELHVMLAAALTQWTRPAEQLAELLEQAGIEPTIKTLLCGQVQEPFRFTRLCLELLPHATTSRVAELLRTNVDPPSDTLHEFHSVTWEMLQHMVKHGVVVGSHTKSHKLLVNESFATILDEIKGSRVELERRLDKKVRHFAYPDGRFNTDALNAVAAAGYRYAYTTCMHRDSQQPMLTIPRRVLWENSCVDGFGRFSPSILSCQINGIFDPAKKCQQSHWESGASLQPQHTP